MMVLMMAWGAECCLLLLSDKCSAVLLLLLMMLNALWWFWQVAGSEDEWLEKQIESEKSISTLEQQIRQLKVRTHPHLWWLLFDIIPFMFACIEYFHAYYHYCCRYLWGFCCGAFSFWYRIRCSMFSDRCREATNYAVLLFMFLVSSI